VRPGGVRVGGQDVAKLAARADGELGEDLAQVVLDRALRNSRAPISGLDRPSRASRATWASWAVSSRMVSTARLRAVSPVAASLFWWPIAVAAATGVTHYFVGAIAAHLRGKGQERRFRPGPARDCRGCVVLRA
jgi:hypothetical protein